MEQELGSQDAQIMLLADQLCDPLKALSQQKNFSYFVLFFLSLATIQWQDTSISIIFSVLAGA